MPYEDEPPYGDFYGEDDIRQDESYPAIKTGLDKVRMPAILLIIVGALNIPGAFFWAVTGANAIWGADTNAQISKEMNMPVLDPAAAKMGASFYFVLCVFSLLAAAITIFGGMRMLKLRSYGLAVFASVLAAIPCISPMGCCGVGEGAGIRSFVVLMNADVRSAFR
jgi:hypothetical protein